MGQAYPVVLGIGSLAALGWIIARRDRPGEADDVFAAAVTALAAGLAGARIGFVLLHGPYFRDHAAEVLWLWEGGLSWVGGAVGAGIGLAVFARLRGRSPLLLADRLAVPAAFVSLAAWTGCFLDRCLYGIPVDASLFSLPSPDLFGTVLPRWPTAAVGMTAAGALAAGVIFLPDHRLAVGMLSALTLGGVAAIALGLSFTRGDPSLLVAGFRLDTVGAAVILVAAAVTACRIGLRSRRT